MSGHLVTKVKIVKTRTDDGYLAKNYLHITKLDSEYGVLLTQYFLLDSVIERDIVVRKYKGKYLTITQTHFKWSTFEKLLDGLVEIMLNNNNQ